MHFILFYFISQVVFCTCTQFSCTISHIHTHKTHIYIPSFLYKDLSYIASFVPQAMWYFLKWCIFLKHCITFFCKGCVGSFYFLSSVCGAWCTLYLFFLDLVVFSFHFGVLVSCFVAVVVLLFDWSFERKREWDSFLGMSEKDSLYPYYS